MFSCEKTSALEEKHSLLIKVKWSRPHSYRIKYADSLEAHNLVKYILETKLCLGFFDEDYDGARGANHLPSTFKGYWREFIMTNI